MKRLLGLAIASLLLSPSAALAEWVNVSAATNGNNFNVETNSSYVIWNFDQVSEAY